MLTLDRVKNPANPLMHPVYYHGQEYLTSQFFHQQYLEHSQASGKHHRYNNFIHVLRSIDAYAIYAAKGDIIDITWNAIRNDSTKNLVEWQALFKAAGWHPLTLLNGAAQAALSHHLDDEFSQQMSVAINTTVARQARKPHELLPIDIAERTMAGTMRIAALLGTSLHIAQQEAVKLVAKETGIDFRPLLQAAPAQSHILPDHRMLEPTDLARELGMGDNKGAAMNLALEAIGWQVKKIGGGWEPTPAGKPQSTLHAWTGAYSTKSGYNLLWNLAAVRFALSQAPQSGSFTL